MGCIKLTEAGAMWFEDDHETEHTIREHGRPPDAIKWVNLGEPYNRGLALQWFDGEDKELRVWFVLAEYNAKLEDWQEQAWMDAMWLRWSGN